MAKRKYKKTDFKQDMDALRKDMEHKALPFPDDPAEQKRRIERARHDRIYFLQTYLPHYCTEESPEYHEELFDLCDTDKEPVSVTGPRGGAKSVIASLAEPLHRILFKRSHYIIFISDTKELAAELIEFVQIELEENERIRQDFGNLRGRRKWQAESFVTKSGGHQVRVRARSQHTRVRGTRFGPHRPDYIVLDDFEDDDQQHSPKILERKYRFICDVVLKALDPTGWTLIYVGTLLSSNSVLSRFMDPKRSPEWVRRNYPAIVKDPETGEERSFWEARFPIKELQADRARNLRSFNQEMMGIVIDEETQKFPRKWFERNRIPLTQEVIDGMKFVVAYVDASAKSGEENDYKAIIPLGWDGARYVVLYAWIRHTSTKLMFDVMHNLMPRFRIRIYGMEEIAFQTLYKDLNILIGEKKGLQIPLKMRDEKLEAKVVRIGSLEPMADIGQVVFCEDGELDAGDMDELVNQFVYFPSTAYEDDGPDAVEGAVWLAQRLGAGIAAGPGGIRTSGRKRVTHSGMRAYA